MLFQFKTTWPSSRKREGARHFIVSQAVLIGPCSVVGLLDEFETSLKELAFYNCDVLSRTQGHPSFTWNYIDNNMDFLPFLRRSEKNWSAVF